MPPTPWFVYLLECADGTLYCGVTTDLERRVAEHNAGTGAKYTRSRGPVRLTEHCICASKSDALKLEIRIKKLPRARKIAALRQTEGEPACRS